MRSVVAPIAGARRDRRPRRRSCRQPQAGLEAAQVAGRRDDRQPQASSRKSSSARPLDGAAHRPRRPPPAPRRGRGRDRAAPPARRSTTRRGGCRPSAARGRPRGSASPSRAPSSGTSSSRSRASSARIASSAGPQLGRVDAGRDLERAGVGVVDEARRDVVGEAARLAHGQEQAAAHPVAEDRVEHREGPGVGMVAAEGRAPRRTAGPGSCRACRVRTRGPAGSVGRRREPGIAPLPVPKAADGQLDRLVVGEVAGDRDDRVGRPVRRPPEVADRRCRQGPDAPPRRRRSRDRAGRRRTSRPGTGSGSTRPDRRGTSGSPR